MCKNTPKVTVLMPVYNGEKYLAEAIESILNQTYKDFEFLIINDGSTDRSAEIIQSYKDSRIRVVHNPKNIKLIATLNKGLELARGEYIARMDCDDICLPNRLQFQVKYMDEHPEVGVLGSRVRNVNEMKDFISEPQRPLTHYGNQWILLFKTSLMHPTVIFRKKLVIDLGGYSKNALHSEDYELWSRLSEHTIIRQQPNVLVILRKHDSNVGKRYRDIQLKTSMNTSMLNILKIVDKKELTKIEDIFKFVRNRDFTLLDNIDVYKSLFNIYFKFTLKNNLSQPERKWITNNFLSIISPIYKLSIIKQIYFIVRSINLQQIKNNDNFKYLIIKLMQNYFLTIISKLRRK